MEIQDLLELLNKIRQEKMNSILFDEEPLLIEFTKKHENSSLVYCDNESFCRSIILLIKLGSNTKMLYFDQHSLDVIELNFSNEKSKKFIESLRILNEKK